MLTNNERAAISMLQIYFDNVCAIFGILGNIKAESNVQPNNLQNSYEKILGFTDETYTRAIDDGSYTRDDFAYDHAGYGLCQWTYWSRKQALYDYWKDNGRADETIGSLRLQIEFMEQEMSNFLKAQLEASKSVEEATRLFMLGYEKPANQSEENIKRRCEISKQLYLDYMKTIDEIYETPQTLSTVEEEVMNEWSLGDEIVDKLGVIVELLERIEKKLEKEEENHADE